MHGARHALTSEDLRSSSAKTGVPEAFGGNSHRSSGEVISRMPPIEAVMEPGMHNMFTEIVLPKMFLGFAEVILRIKQARQMPIQPISAIEKPADQRFRLFSSVIFNIENWLVFIENRSCSFEYRELHSLNIDLDQMASFKAA